MLGLKSLGSQVVIILSLCRSQHTLPVTDLCLGATPSNTVLASVSADQSCKIWNLATGISFWYPQEEKASLCTLPQVMQQHI